MTGVLDRARSDVAAGRAWKARDRLVGALVHRADDEALDLLAQVHADMGDLPAAGALWFVTGRDDERARQATAAWRERHGNDPLQLWYSLPRLAREPRRHGLHVEHRHVEDLHREAVAAVDARLRSSRRPPGPSRERGESLGDAVGGIMAAVAGVLLVCVFVVGLVTSIAWAARAVGSLLG